MLLSAASFRVLRRIASASLVSVVVAKGWRVSRPAALIAVKTAGGRLPGYVLALRLCGEAAAPYREAGQGPHAQATEQHDGGRGAGLAIQGGQDHPSLGLGGIGGLAAGRALVPRKGLRRVSWRRER